MTLLQLQIYYIFLILLLICYLLLMHEQRPFAFAFSVIINVFPLMFLPYFGMDMARILGIPLSYLPIFSIVIFYFIMYRLKIIKGDFLWILFCLLFIVYITMTSFINEISILTLIYYISWPINFFIFLQARSYYSSVNSYLIPKLIKILIYIIALGCIVGLIRYNIGISQDANFMPTMNRNGVVIFLIINTPLVFYLRDIKFISKINFFLIWILISVTLFSIQSRSGLICFAFVTLIYHFRFRYFIYIIFFIIISFALLSFSFTDNSTQRLILTIETIQKLIDEGDPNQDETDYARAMLLKSAMIIIKENFWLGTGVGLDNYRTSFHHLITEYARDSKSHNFYLSYFAELGIIGFSILLIILYGVFKKISCRDKMSFAFRIAFLGTALNMTMNEYILMPELWFFFGMLSGFSYATEHEYKSCHTSRITYSSCEK